MRKTKKLLKWVDETVIRYALYLKIEKPKITYDIETFLKAIKPLYSYTMSELSIKVKRDLKLNNALVTNYGGIDSTYKVMSLNLRNHSDKDKLKNTIVHELSHKALRINGHPEELYKLIEKTLKKG